MEKMWYRYGKRHGIEKDKGYNDDGEANWTHTERGKQAKWNTRKIVEYENKVNQLEDEKGQLCSEMVQKTNLIIFQHYRQEQYIRENILIHGVGKDKGYNYDGEDVLISIAIELEIDLQPDDIQGVNHLEKQRINKENPRLFIRRFVSYKKGTNF